MPSIRSYRQEYKLSQSDLALKLRVPVENIAALESGNPIHVIQRNQIVLALRGLWSSPNLKPEDIKEITDWQ